MSQFPRTAAQQSALDQLFTRHSPWPLVDPAPSRDVLAIVMEAALRAPDHGLLQPWRFVLIEGEARHAFGEVLVQAARQRDPTDDGARFRRKALAAPVIIVMAAHIHVNHKVPEIEQVLAVGAGAMNMLNTLHILGYGGFWATGANTYDPHVKQALGFAATDQIIGFMYVGTPESLTPPIARVAPTGLVREWTGPVSR